MNFVDISTADLVGIFVGFVLTLLVFSYLLGDNPLFRLAISLFVGVAAGYAAVVAVYSVLLPRLFVPLMGPDRGEQILALVSLFLSVLLLLKISPRLARWGNPAMAYLVGVGVASAIGGAVMGTLFPQVGASINLFDRQVSAASTTDFWLQLVNGFVILVGTVTTLAFFHFGANARPGEPTGRLPWIEELARIGQIFIAVTFGALFAGVYASALSALVERLYTIVNFLRSLLTSFL